MGTPWYVEKYENVNYIKLCRLLYDGGTLAVKTVFDGIVPPASLGSVLTANRPILQRLKRPAGNVLSEDQWDLLYPPGGASPKSEAFDITLLFVLLRNICGLTPPATGWDALPPTTNTSIEAKLVRIKYYRNKVIAHCSKAEIDDTQFEVYWNDISGALVALGLKQDDIDHLKSSPLGEKEYNRLMKEWELSDKEIKEQLEAIERRLHDMDLQMHQTQQSEIDNLAHVDYTSLIKNNCGKYHSNTRQWVLDQVELNVRAATTKASVVLIRAGPGMGKSIVAAKICQIYKKQELLGGCHFFQHSDSRRNNPRIMLQSIARQLCNTVPGYQVALETKLKTLQGRPIAGFNCEELFGVLFEEPLSQIHMNHNVVIVIDALDECSSQHKKELENAFNTEKLSLLPSWIQFVITSRPLPSFRSLSQGVPIEIVQSDLGNRKDVEEFLFSELANRDAQHLINKCMEISEGLFLVAYFVLEMLNQFADLSLPNVTERFSHGIASVYEYYFTRIKDLITPYIDTSQSEDSFYKMLEAVVVSESPLPKEMFYDILCLKSENKVPREKRKEELMQCIYCTQYSQSRMIMSLYFTKL